MYATLIENWNVVDRTKSVYYRSSFFPDYHSAKVYADHHPGIVGIQNVETNVVVWRDIESDLFPDNKDSL